MGIIQKGITVRKGTREVFVNLATIDTGSDYTILPPDVAAELDLQLTLRRTVVIEVADGRGLEIHGPYRVSVILDNYVAKNVNIYFWPYDSVTFESIVGHNFMQASGYKIDYSKELPSRRRIKRIRYIRAIYHQNARVPPGQLIRKPKKIKGRWWMVDCRRDDEGKIQYRKLYIILPEGLPELRKHNLINE